jgi:gliding motility-associated-like protein
MKKILTSLVFLSFLITGFSQNLDSMLLLYYPFSGNANDASGNGYHGMVFNATLADDRFGNPNSAYYFNGINSYIEFPNFAALKPPLPMSFSFWIQIQDYGQPYTNFFTTDFTENMGSGVWGNFSANTGRIAVNYGEGTPNSTGPHNRRTKVGNSQLLLNTWYFVIFIIRGPQDMDIYVNCLNDGGTYSGTGGPLAYTSNAGNLGKHDLIGNPPFFFLGYLDEFRYWDRALTQADIDLMCAMNVDAGNHITICEGDSVVIGGLPAVEGGTPPVTWEWTPATGLSDPFVQNPTAFPSTTTTYTIQATDFFGFVETDSVTITVLPWEDASILPVADYCDNHNIDTLLSVQTGGQWWGTGITDPLSGEFSPAVAGTGTHTVFYGIPGLCGDTASVNINVYPAPVVNLGADTTVCEGDTLYFDAGAGADSYIWNNADTTQIIAVGASGIYSVTVTNAFLCQESDDVEVTVLPWEDASILPVADYCDNHNIDTLLSVQTGGQWWGTGITDPLSGEFSPAVAGTGTHTVFYGIPGLCGDTASVNINVYPASVVNLGADTTVCEGDTLYFDAGAGADSYIWNNADTTQIIAVGASGIYSVTVTNAFLCQESDDVEVTVLPWEDASILPVADYCDNHNIDTLLSVQTGGQWWGTGITDPLSGEFSPAVAGTGTHTVFYGIPGLCGDTASVNINVYPAPVVNLGADTTVCEGDTLYFDAGAGADSYIWNNADTTQIIAVGASGIYSVTVTNAFLCQESDDVEVTVLPWADATITPVEPVCANEDEFIIGAAQQGGNWSGNGIINSGTGLFNPFAAGDGTHLITYTIPGLCGDQDTVSIIVWPYPLVLGTGQSETCIDANDGWAVVFISGGTMPFSIAWSNGDESDTITNLSPGIYECFVIDANGCRNHLIISVEESMEDCYPPHIYVPNVFSPNGDGENDVLFVRGENISFLEFIIYNRWGNRIFITNDINKGWDGTYKGKMCEPAVFTYIVSATFTNGEKVVKSGNVTLVR